eukprot:11388888-Heterocapsa_arctica.AAC.1
MPAHIKNGEQAIAKGWSWEHWEGNDQADRAAERASRGQQLDADLVFRHRMRLRLAEGGLSIIAAVQDAGPA